MAGWGTQRHWTKFPTLKYPTNLNSHFMILFNPESTNYGSDSLFDICVFLRENIEDLWR